MKEKELKIKAARDLGPQFTDNKHNMVGQDGAYSFPVKDGVFWFFGDTFIGKRTPGESLWYPGGVPVGPKDMSGTGRLERMINNTGLILRDSTGREGLRNFTYITDEKGDVKPLIELLPEEDHDEVRIWCLHGVEIGGDIYLFFIKVVMLESGLLPVNFDLLGSGIAKGKEGEWKFERILNDGNYLLWKKDEPKFAAAVLKGDDEYLYMYGVIQKDFVQQCYIARVMPDKIEQINKYEYYSGNNIWSNSIGEAVPVMTGMPNELSVSYNEYLGKYLAVHSLDLSGQIVGRTSETPWGPWSEPVVLWQVSTKREKELPYPVLIYAGKEHPTLSEEGGKRIYITYIEFEEYYPHLIEVEFE